MANEDPKAASGAGGQKAAPPAAGAAKRPAGPEPKPASFAPLEQKKPDAPVGNLDFILDVPLEIRVEMGGAKILIRDLLQLGQGSVVELEKMAGEPMELYIGDKLVARGEVVVVNDKFGIRLTDIVSAAERIKQLSKG
ncbi:MAG: flagellar motor switch protein FliN [Candidatus Manganitrophaceae bacterium]|nr:MAG: flagellar motor switch protein FliN [Candidatus Manganitrophaceae bacterium]